MATRVYRPTTPARRGMSSRDTAVLTVKKPVKSLVRAGGVSKGRNDVGKITVRHRGGGVKRRYRLVDFKSKVDSEGTVKTIEYDPNRSAHIALVEDSDGELSYILAEAKMKVGQKLRVSAEAPIKSANRLPLSAIPTGSSIYNIELEPGRGGQLARSAGASATLAAKDEQYAQVRLPSGEIRLINLGCYATLGAVGNEAHQHIKWGSAGRRRRLGWRPSVRGKAMNPSDHHMGGGEGKSGPGRHPTTPWGKPAIGAKTRRRKRTQKMIVRSRSKGRR